MFLPVFLFLCLLHECASSAWKPAVVVDVAFTLKIMFNKIVVHQTRDGYFNKLLFIEAEVDTDQAMKSTTVLIQHLMINFISINQTCVQPTTISHKANELEKNRGNCPKLDGKLLANERVHKAMSTDFGCVEMMSMSVTLDHSNCAIDLLYSCIY